MLCGKLPNMYGDYYWRSRWWDWLFYHYIFTIDASLIAGVMSMFFFACRLYFFSHHHNRQRRPIATVCVCACGCLCCKMPEIVYTDNLNNGSSFMKLAGIKNPLSRPLRRHAEIVLAHQKTDKKNISTQPQSPRYFDYFMHPSSANIWNNDNVRRSALTVELAHVSLTSTSSRDREHSFPHPTGEDYFFRERANFSLS